MAETARTTVLLVDDQAIVGQMVRRILDAAGDASLHFCTDSEKALEMAHQVQPTVILQDLSMPGIDGLDLLDRYQTDEQLRDVPIVVLSGREDAKVKAQALARGASDYIVKLPDPVELIARVRRHSQGFVQRQERRRSEEASRTAEQAASRANRAKSVFLANMGRQLRTPLNSILGNTHVLEEDAELSEASARAVAQIAAAGADLAQLIERIVHASSIDGTPMPVERVDVDLAGLLSEVSGVSRTRCQDKGLTWNYEEQLAGLCVVRTDPSLVRQILTQLLDNAIEYTSKGEVCLAVTASPSRLHFAIEDSGPGMPADLRGTQQDPGAAVAEGRGVGLSLARSLVKSLHGELHLEEATAGGTRVTIALPVEPATGSTAASSR